MRGILYPAMPLSPSTIQDIQSELAALQQPKVKIDERVAALEAILVPLDLGQAALPFTNGMPSLAIMMSGCAIARSMFASFIMYMTT